jgi:hypothetical protein
MGMESFNSPVSPQEGEIQAEKPAQETPENTEELDAKQEKIKELSATVDFWSEYAKSQLSYFNEVYDVQKMGENVQHLGAEAGKSAEHYNWVKNKLELYSAMIPAFEDIKKVLAEGKLEYPWGGSVEQDIRTWERRGNNS